MYLRSLPALCRLQQKRPGSSFLRQRKIKVFYGHQENVYLWKLPGLRSKRFKRWIFLYRLKK